MKKSLMYLWMDCFSAADNWSACNKTELLIIVINEASPPVSVPTPSTVPIEYYEEFLVEPGQKEKTWQRATGINEWSWIDHIYRDI